MAVVVIVVVIRVRVTVKVRVGVPNKGREFGSIRVRPMVRFNIIKCICLNCILNLLFAGASVSLVKGYI